MPDVSIDLDSRRRDRVQALQKVQHLVPGVVLLLDGLQALSTGAAGVERVIAIGEIVTCALFLGSVARQFLKLRERSPHAHHAHGVDWVDIFISAMLAVEVWAH